MTSLHVVLVLELTSGLPFLELTLSSSSPIYIIGGKETPPRPRFGFKHPGPISGNCDALLSVTFIIVGFLALDIFRIHFLRDYILLCGSSI